MNRFAGHNLRNCSSAVSLPRPACQYSWSRILPLRLRYSPIVVPSVSAVSSSNFLFSFCLQRLPVVGQLVGLNCSSFGVSRVPGQALRDFGALVPTNLLTSASGEGGARGRAEATALPSNIAFHLDLPPGPPLGCRHCCAAGLNSPGSPAFPRFRGCFPRTVLQHCIHRLHEYLGLRELKFKICSSRTYKPIRRKTFADSILQKHYSQIDPDERHELRGSEAHSAPTCTIPTKTRWT